jgi:hypothetical protein
VTNTRAISLIVHTRNSAHVLPELLRTTTWCDERIVVDMASTDGTADLARAAGCRVVTIEPEPFTDALRNRFLGEAAHPWTLVLDSDEYLAADAEEGLRAAVAAAEVDVDGVWIPRFNSIAGRVLRGSGWYPDHQLRLFRTGAIRYEVAHHRVPQLVDPTRRTVRLEPPGCVHIHHENYASFVEFVERQLTYARTDVYDDDPDRFDFTTYLARAAQEFDDRLDSDADGDHAYALAVLMYGNQLLRGIVHWERLGYRPPLPTEPPLPVREVFVTPVDDAEVAALRARIAELEGAVTAVHASRSMRVTRPLRRAGDIARRILRPVRGT